MMDLTPIKKAGEGRALTNQAQTPKIMTMRTIMPIKKINKRKSDNMKNLMITEMDIPLESKGIQ